MARRGDIVSDAAGSCFLVWSILEIDGVLCCFRVTTGRDKGSVLVRQRIHILTDAGDIAYVATATRRYFSPADVGLEGWAEPGLMRDIAAALRVQAMADNRAVPVRRYGMPASYGRRVGGGVNA